METVCDIIFFMSTAMESQQKFIPMGKRGVEFGPQLRKMRQDRGETIEQAARGIGIYGSTLCRLENGSRGAGYDIAQAIARYYGVAVSDIRAD